MNENLKNTTKGFVSYCKQHPKLSIFIAILVVLWIIGPKTEPTQTSSSSSSGYFTESSIRSICSSYQSARQGCATAANLQQCIEIKMGVNDAHMAQSTYCDASGEPNLWLLKK